MTDDSHSNTDILIAGGGPVGLAAACLLSSSGLKVMLVDAGKEVVTTGQLQEKSGDKDFDPRVSALTVASQGLLETTGAWPVIAATRVCPYQKMSVWDGEGTGAIHFSAAELHEETLGYIVENRLMAAVLEEQARKLPNLEIRKSERVEHIGQIETQEEGEEGQEGPVQVHLAGGEVIRARLLVGADGANSVVREKSGFTLRQWAYGHQAIVTTVKTEKPHQYTAWQRFMQSGPLAFLPLQLPGTGTSGQHYCSIVWSCVTERAEGLLALSDEDFMEALGAAFEFRLGKILETEARMSFPLWQRHATDYVQPNIALIGDAAHTIHPLAGQGVNMGFADVQALSEAVSGAVARSEDFASLQVLSRYQRRRKGENLGMMAAMEGFKHLFASEELILKWLRNTGLNLTDKSPMLKQRLMRQAMGL